MTPDKRPAMRWVFFILLTLGALLGFRFRLSRRTNLVKLRPISDVIWVMKWISKAWAVLVICGLSLAPSFAFAVCKTVRVEHGRPLVVVSAKAVLLLEFLKEPIAEALIPHEGSGWEHCRARYRYRLFDGATGSVTNGEGMVEEIYRIVSSNATGRQVEDMGSRTGIGAGEFGFGWSQATAGSRSWLYYQATSGIRFIQQPQRINFDAVNPELYRRYLTSKNVEEFVSASQTVQVIGPAVFSGDLPTETPVSARIQSCRVQDGAVEMKLSNLNTNKNYVIESSYELKTGDWTAVHSFPAREPNHEWSDPLAKEISVVFYRIREGQ